MIIKQKNLAYTNTIRDFLAQLIWEMIEDGCKLKVDDF